MPKRCFNEYRRVRNESCLKIIGIWRLLRLSFGLMPRLYRNALMNILSRKKLLMLKYTSLYFAPLKLAAYGGCGIINDCNITIPAMTIATGSRLKIENERAKLCQ